MPWIRFKSLQDIECQIAELERELKVAYREQEDAASAKAQALEKYAERQGIEIRKLNATIEDLEAQLELATSELAEVREGARHLKAEVTSPCPVCAEREKELAAQAREKWMADCPTNDDHIVLGARYEYAGVCYTLELAQPRRSWITSSGDSRQVRGCLHLRKHKDTAVLTLGEGSIPGFIMGSKRLGV